MKVLAGIAVGLTVGSALIQPSPAFGQEASDDAWRLVAGGGIAAGFAGLGPFAELSGTRHGWSVTLRHLSAHRGAAEEDATEVDLAELAALVGWDSRSAQRVWGFGLGPALVDGSVVRYGGRVAGLGGFAPIGGGSSLELLAENRGPTVGLAGRLFIRPHGRSGVGMLSLHANANGLRSWIAASFGVWLGG